LFRTIVISPDSEMGDRLVSALEATGQVAIARRMDSYPTAIDLTRSLRAHAVDVLFISFQVIEKARDIVKLLEAEASHVQIIAFHKQMDPAVLRETMRAGVREFLVDPFERRAIMESLTQMKELLDRRPAVYESTNQIFSFLPSKAGVGTSTIALNVSAMLARKPDTRVLLSDFDLNSGMMRFMLKLTNTYSVTDAVEHAAEMDENLWPPLVTQIEGMDVLHAGPVNPSYRIEPGQIRHLITFLRRNYQALCFDLSGNLERYSIELMLESRRVFLVCTPEIPSLHLAREKMQYLKSLDLDSRVSVILNRAPKKPLFSNEQVEELLGARVVNIFPNDYPGVNRAVAAGTLVAPASDLGKVFSQFAHSLQERPAPETGSSTRKFLQFFSVSPETLASRRDG
jgi:pilus assembly protein CpaE